MRSLGLITSLSRLCRLLLICSAIYYTFKIKPIKSHQRDADWSNFRLPVGLRTVAIQCGCHPSVVILFIQWLFRNDPIPPPMLAEALTTTPRQSFVPHIYISPLREPGGEECTCAVLPASMQRAWAVGLCSASKDSRPCDVSLQVFAVCLVSIYSTYLRASVDSYVPVQ